MTFPLKFLFPLITLTLWDFSMLIHSPFKIARSLAWSFSSAAQNVSDYSVLKKKYFFNLYSFSFSFFFSQHGMLFYFGIKSTSEMQLFPRERGRSPALVTSNHKRCFIRTCPGFRHLVWFLLPKCPYLALATAIPSISSGCCSVKAQILCHIHQHSTDSLDAPGLWIGSSCLWLAINCFPYI